MEQKGFIFGSMECSTSVVMFRVCSNGWWVFISNPSFFSYIHCIVHICTGTRGALDPDFGDPHFFSVGILDIFSKIVFATLFFSGVSVFRSQDELLESFSRHNMLPA
uniref:Uncharacterized protein n=1 Tax=Kalanchoe fedtschenkoi TaxID=63787 RepID=A0A7N0TD53_KALFE